MACKAWCILLTLIFASVSLFARPNNTKFLYNTGNPVIMPFDVYGQSVGNPNYNRGNIYADPWVIYENGQYEMWVDLSHWTSSSDCYEYIEYMTSTDGIHWGTPVIAFNPNPGGCGTSPGVTRPNVIKRNGVYMLYWNDANASHPNIHLATSTTPQGPFVEQGVVLSPAGGWDGNRLWVASVVWNEASNQYEMWYSGGVYVESFGLTEPLGVGFATSPDGRSFTPYAGNPIVTAPGCSTGLWYCDAVGSFRVRLIDGVYHCFYSAAGNDGVFRIGYTTSTSPTSWNLQSNDLIVDRTPHNTYGHDGNYAPGFVRTNGYWSVWWNGRNEVTGVEAVLMAQEYPQQVVISNAVLGSAVIK